MTTRLETAMKQRRIRKLTQAHGGLGFNINMDDLVEIQVRRTTNNANDTLGRGTIYVESLVDIQAR